MAKALPILGIVGALLAALVFAVLVDAGVFLVVPVTLVASIVLVGQRSIPGAVAGLLVLALTVLAALGLAGSVSTEDGETDFGFSPESGLVLALAACLAVPAAAIVVRWEDAQPRWLAIAGLALAAIALLVGFLDRDTITDHGRILTIVEAVLALTLVAPMVPLLRGSADAPAELAPLAVTDAPVRSAPIARPPPSPPKAPAARPPPPSPPRKP